MARVRRTGVHLHTGDPGSKARTPVWGARDAAGSGIIDPDAPRKSAPRARTAKCSWCGAPNAVAASNPKRCRRCATLGRTIAAAEKFVASKGLRPLGGSIVSDSPEEEQHRRAAVKARATLNNVRRQPAKKKSGKASPKPREAQPAGARKQRKSTSSGVAPTKKPKNGRNAVRDKATPAADDRRLLASVQLRIRDEQKQGYDRTASGQARLAKLRELERNLQARLAVGRNGIKSTSSR